MNGGLRVRLLVGVLAVGVAAMTACGSPGDAHRGPVTDEVEAIVRAMGVEPERAAMQGYAYRSIEGGRACRDVADRDDHWIAERSAILPAGLVSGDGVVEAVAGRYQSAGARVTRYRSTESGQRIVYAVDEERSLHVKVETSAEGRASVFVTLSPCAAGLTTEPRGPYELEP